MSIVATIISANGAAILSKNGTEDFAERILENVAFVDRGRLLIGLTEGAFNNGGRATLVAAIDNELHLLAISLLLRKRRSTWWLRSRIVAGREQDRWIDRVNGLAGPLGLAPGIPHVQIGRMEIVG